MFFIPSVTDAENILGQVKLNIRAEYGFPPKHGGAIVDTILSDPDLTKEWHRVNNKIYLRKWE